MVSADEAEGCEAEDEGGFAVLLEPGLRAQRQRGAGGHRGEELSGAAATVWAQLGAQSPDSEQRSRALAVFSLRWHRVLESGENGNREKFRGVEVEATPDLRGPGLDETWYAGPIEIQTLQVRMHVHEEGM